MSCAISGDLVHVLSPRETGKFITSRCKDVKINDDQVVKTAAVLAKEFQRKNYSLGGWKSHPLHPKEADEKAIDTIFVIDVLNFSFWPNIPGKKFGINYEGKLHTGYWSLVAALKRSENDGKPLYDAKYMADISYEAFATIFQSDTGIDLPLLSERWEGYTQSGKILMEKFGGSFVNCVRKSGKDAVALLRLIVENFPSFRDESVFEDQRVAFYKRAQILIADIWCCFEGQGLGEFTNIEEITMFADYRVPQTLVYFGILEYSEELTRNLIDRAVWSPGDRLELEIRGACIEATERLVDAVRSFAFKHGDNDSTHFYALNAITVDNFLWDYAREYRDKVDRLPFHLVRTIYY